jgi:hypothetical protein
MKEGCCLKNAELIFLTMFIYFFAGCQNSSSGFKRQEINLSNELGIISIELPIQVDTFFSWVSTSDCAPCCNEKMYRFADKDYSLLKETGFFYHKFPDSLYQFTIRHKETRGCESEWSISENSLDSIVSIKENQSLEAFAGEESIAWILREIRYIDKRMFLVFAYKEKSPFTRIEYSTILEAFTIQDDEILHFKYECTGNFCVDFISKMDESLKSIRFKTAKN